MCVVAVKYIDEYGWIGAKNRDRNYPVDLEIVTSNRKGIQRLYIDDQITRWTEGINEFGVSIISASLSVKSDEKEGGKAKGKGKGKKNMVSPDGLAIRNALLLKDPLSAVKLLIEAELAGSTFVFNKNKCYLLEGGFTMKKAAATEDSPREYKHSLKEIKKGDVCCVRTNHGIDLPFLGYAKDAKDAATKKNRKSSELRWKITNDAVKSLNIATPYDFLDAMSMTPNDDPFLNPIRKGDPKKGDMVTTGQLLLIPTECSLHYRPIYSKVSFDYAKLNDGEKAKTFFEIISSRKLLSFKEYFDINKNI